MKKELYEPLGLGIYFQNTETAAEAIEKFGDSRVNEIFNAGVMYQSVLKIWGNKFAERIEKDFSFPALSSKGNPKNAEGKYPEGETEETNAAFIKRFLARNVAAGGELEDISKYQALGQEIADSIAFDAAKAVRQPTKLPKQLLETAQAAMQSEKFPKWCAKHGFDPASVTVEDVAKKIRDLNSPAALLKNAGL